MIDALERSNVRLLGVVMMEEAAINHDALRGETEQRAEWEQRRRPGAGSASSNTTLRRAEKSF
jgi:hypothetical protein